MIRLWPILSISMCTPTPMTASWLTRTSLAMCVICCTIATICPPATFSKAVFLFTPRSMSRCRMPLKLPPRTNATPCPMALTAQWRWSSLPLVTLRQLWAAPIIILTRLTSPRVTVRAAGLAVRHSRSSHWSPHSIRRSTRRAISTARRLQPSTATLFRTTTTSITALVPSRALLLYPRTPASFA